MCLCETRSLYFLCNNGYQDHQSDDGVSWNNCHNRQRFEHVFDAHLASTDQVLNTGDIIDLMRCPDEPVARYKD